MFDPEKVERHVILGKGAKLIEGPPTLKVDDGDAFTCVHSSDYDQLLKLYHANQIALKSVIEVCKEAHDSLHRFTKAMIESPS